MVHLVLHELTYTGGADHCSNMTLLQPDQNNWFVSHSDVGFLAKLTSKNKNMTFKSLARKLFANLAEISSAHCVEKLDMFLNSTILIKYNHLVRLVNNENYINDHDNNNQLGTVFYARAFVKGKHGSVASCAKIILR